MLDILDNAELCYIAGDKAMVVQADDCSKNISTWEGARLMQ